MTLNTEEEILEPAMYLNTVFLTNADEGIDNVKSVLVIGAYGKIIVHALLRVCIALVIRFDKDKVKSGIL